MAMTYVGGVAPIVTTYGPGNLHHMAYSVSASVSGLIDVMGFIPTSNEGVSHFVLGFSYAYAGYAFYWDGAGDASFRIGNSTQTNVVGNSWANATGVPGNGEIILGLNVASTAKAAQDRGDGPSKTIAYRIPDDLN
ncbi:hypothetical protein FB45DRAFT_1007810 [Roridomyces roridus]|uniref:Uncharacterized protein n=1 Tax=Roridomyces roridus TaxID=1738132 RepID=A0AAD7FDB0_9AGAR|nr:hypothetical protein FB45DRAFT_1007810 [Roridomyces roridus]